jgi:hypothetical protein
MGLALPEGAVYRLDFRRADSERGQKDKKQKRFPGVPGRGFFVRLRTQSERAQTISAPFTSRCHSGGVSYGGGGPFWFLLSNNVF